MGIDKLHLIYYSLFGNLTINRREVKINLLLEHLRYTYRNGCGRLGPHEKEPNKKKV